MDHLPLPNDSASGPFNIPFLSKQRYDNGEFSTYPERVGWTVRQTESCIYFSSNGQEILDQNQIGAFVQTWLYFGLLHAVTGVSPDHARFKHHDSEGRARFSSANLENIIGPWSNETIEKSFEIDRIELKRNADLDHSMSVNMRVAAAMAQVDRGDSWSVEDEEALWSQCLTQVLEEDDKSRARAEEDDENSRMSSWIRQRYEHFRQARDVVLRIVATSDEGGEGDLRLICLSIATLCEYLGQSLADIADARGLGSVAGELPIWLLQDAKLDMPIIQRMRGSGWCPNRLAGLHASHWCTVGVLWYLSNLKPPRVDDQHRTCVAERCNSLQVDLQDYKVIHESAGCQCQFAEPESHRLAEIVSCGSIALVSISGDPQNLQVRLHDQRQESRRYVAFSHVWADGRGNLTHNALHACTLYELQKYVDALGLDAPGSETGTPFWIDTLCLPRDPMSLRRKAIANLSSVFEQAASVLVLDSYLAGLESAGMTLTEILARITISGWTQRLWTFSEGQLNKNIWFQFRDRAVDLYSLMEQWQDRQRQRRVPCSASGSLDWDLVTMYNATYSFRWAGVHIVHLFPLRAALSTRQTSWASDEALCLGAVHGLDLKKIADAEDDKKMAVFWSLTTSLHPGLLFARMARRICCPGVRWAPPTLLGMGSEDDWDTTSSDLDLKAKPSCDGLLVKLPAVTFNAAEHESKYTFRTKCNLLDRFLGTDTSQEATDFVLQDQQGTWYDCSVEWDWHQLPFQPDYKDAVPAVLLNVPFVTDGVTGEIRPLKYQGPVPHDKRRRGLFVTRKQTDTTKAPAYTRVSVHKHVTVAPASSDKQEFLTCVKACADGISNMYGEDIEAQKNRDVKGIEPGVIFFEHILMLTHEYIKSNNVPLLEFARNVLTTESSRTSDKAALDICARHVRHFIQVGDWYQVDMSEDLKAWCVD